MSHYPRKKRVENGRRGIEVQLPVETVDQLDEHVEQFGGTRSDLICSVLTRWLKRQS